MNRTTSGTLWGFVHRPPGHGCYSRICTHVGLAMIDMVVLYTLLYLVIPVQRQRQCHVMSLVVGIQGQKAYGLCKTPLCAELVVQFSP